MDIHDLSHPWCVCFELAWGTFQAGATPVGAAVVDEASGEMLSRSDFRRYGADGRLALAGSAVGHAEVQALAQIPRGTEGVILYTTVEPCVMCAGAARMAHVSAVHFAGPDPYWAGAERMPELCQAISHRWPIRQGPLTDEWGAWGLFVPLMHHLGRNRPEDGFIEACHAAFPELSRVATAAVDAGGARHLSLGQALETLGPRVAEVGLR